MSTGMNPACEFAPEARIAKLDVIGLGNQFGEPLPRKSRFNAHRINAFGRCGLNELCLHVERHCFVKERFARCHTPRNRFEQRDDARVARTVGQYAHVRECIRVGLHGK
ncbi:hypothetical protein AWB67_06963 [Caballeronia terrestris]|uniref:Uncharacterized protein n=1 Tax=Caballeronia terrestris TaxID=1226301 RepID=A0A158KY20_9BURK|nr:hypothetical protein AWB67_06963 [Caballeronia terrestris]